MKTRRFEQRGVVARVVGHHDHRGRVKAIDQQPAHLVDVEIEWPADPIAVAPFKPRTGLVYQHAGDGGIINGFELTEIPHPPFARIQRAVIDLTRYRAHHLATARRQPSLDLGVLKPRALPAPAPCDGLVERLDPGRIGGINALGEAVKCPPLLTILDRLDNHIGTVDHRFAGPLSVAERAWVYPQNT